jgi:hypothetical protein
MGGVRLSCIVSKSKYVLMTNIRDSKLHYGLLTV